MDKIPNVGDDIIHMITSGPIRIEMTLNGEVYLIDMLDRKKYRLVTSAGYLQLMIIEQE